MNTHITTWLRHSVITPITNSSHMSTRIHSMRIHTRSTHTYTHKLIILLWKLTRTLILPSNNNTHWNCMHITHIHTSTARSFDCNQQHTTNIWWSHCVEYGTNVCKTRKCESPRMQSAQILIPFLMSLLVTCLKL